MSTTVSRQAMVIASILVFVACRSLASGFTHGETTLLRMKPSKNSTFTFDIRTASLQQMDVAGQEMSTEATSELTVHLRAKDVALDRTTFACRFAKARASVSIRGFEMELPKTDTMIDLESIDGVETTISANPTGVILSLSTHGNEKLESLLTSMKVMDRILPTLPVQEIQVGEAWSRSTVDTTGSQQGTGSVITRVTMKNTFRGSKDTLGVACWLIESASTAFVQEGTISTNGIDMQLEGSGSQQMRTFVEKRTGMIMVSSGKVNSDTRLALTGQQEMTISVDTQMSFSVIRQLKQK